MPTSDARNAGQRSPLGKAVGYFGPLALAVGAMVMMMPPQGQFWLAFVFLVPALAWARWGRGGGFLWGWLWGLGSWTLLLWFMRHTIPPAPLLLGAYVGLYYGAWTAAAVRLLRGRTPSGLDFVTLAALWAALEYTRGWVFGGFPWLPTAAAMTVFPPLLDPVAWAGQGLLTLLLAAGNVWLMACWPLRRRWPVLLAGAPVFATALLGGWSDVIKTAEGHAGFVDGRFDPWQASARRFENWQVLVQQTRDLAAQGGPAGGGSWILWPEGVTPAPAHGDGAEPARMRFLLEDLSRSTGATLMIGSNAVFGDPETGRARWYNTGAAVTPERGLAPQFYAKRQLVPFGEFIPFSGVLRALGIAPVVGEFSAGRGAQLIEVQSRRVGFLVCYEDAFPHLARDSALAGADVFVLTAENAWYGDEGMTEQHLAHTVLRATETGRDVLRVSNGGLSGVVLPGGVADWTRMAPGGWREEVWGGVWRDKPQAQQALPAGDLVYWLCLGWVGWRWWRHARRATAGAAAAT